MDVMKPWIAKRITEMLGFEDDIVVELGPQMWRVDEC